MANPAWLTAGADFVSVQVRLRPRSSRRGLLRVDSDALAVGVGSPAEKGRANQELIEFIARAAGLPRSAIAIVRGATSRDKLVRIATRNPTEIVSRLIAISSAAGLRAR